MAVITFHPWWLPTSSSLLYPIFSPLRILHATVYTTLSLLLNVLVGLGVLYAVLHHTGVLKRLVRKFAEWQLRKNCNGALFTIGDINVNILRGTATVSDLIVHSPHRSEWQWDSPVIARASKISVSFNVLSTIDHVGPLLGFPAKDVHTVLVEDVVFFVEKRRNVFNFHLLDESLDLPDPVEVLDSMRRDRVEGGAAATLAAASPALAATAAPAAASHATGTVHNSSAAALTADGTEGAPTVADEGTGAASDRAAIDGPPASTAADQSAEEGEDKASEIVTHVLGAVSTIGRAANEGGKEGLHTALKSQKDGFVSQLKQFKANVGAASGNAGGVGGAEGGVSKPTAGSSAVKKHTKSIVTAMKQMGKVVERSVSDMKEQVDSFQRPPRKREGWKRKNPDERFRFGYVVVRDMRIFSKDIIVTQKSGGGAAGATGSAAAAAAAASAGGGSAAPVDGSSGPTGDDAAVAASAVSRSSPPGVKAPSRPATLAGWSRPILIKELAISGAELCPPARARNDRTGLPEFGLHIDRVLDIVVKKLLAETAKTNSGRVLQTAFGEVFSWMDVKRSDSKQYARA